MRKNATWQWIYGGLAAALSMTGLFQLVQGCALGWAAVISAALILIGLFVWRRWPTRYRWGLFPRAWGVYTGFVWLVAVILGIFGWGGELPWGAWGAGPAVALVAIGSADSDDQRARDRTDPAPRPEGVRKGTES